MLIGQAGKPHGYFDPQRFTGRGIQRFRDNDQAIIFDRYETMVKDGVQVRGKQ